MKPRPQRAITPEPIRPGELWPIRLLHDRLAWGARTRAQAIKQGLRVHRWGKLAYVATDDLIAFLTGRGNNAGNTPRVIPAVSAGNGQGALDHISP